MLLLTMCNVRHNYGKQFSPCYRHCYSSAVASHGIMRLLERVIVGRRCNDLRSYHVFLSKVAFSTALGNVCGFHLFASLPSGS